ncbi:lipopolysaccharide biosynthesis protein [Sphingomicrobium aestuariivivum]|uniref:lipopolysaccharide biosynthesis protein n=1 Tax=Sphingomicrobium aestuariivivum TaxID=1582356 RepID=UPI001FD69656|nr:oligosaccharide flippase family protein [Sphingomicrobium aestuariivivum]MCJ8190771.1 oligosaccharide flippase family protein [Sphingomicrobium aestuariivivum]
MNAKRFLALQSLFYAFANGIEALVPFLLAPILTRALDPAEYGIWVLFITYATFLRPIVGLTTQDAIRMRFYDFDQKQLDQFTHTILFVMTVLALAVAGLTWILREPLEAATKFPAEWLATVVLGAFLFEVFYTALALQQFHNNRKAFLLTQVAQAVLSLVFISGFLYAGWDWRGVILGRMGGLSIAALLSLWTLGYRPRAFLRIPERSFYRQIARFGVIYWPSGMVIMAVAMTDKVVAAHYLGVSASAIYGVAALFASAYWVLNHSFVLAWTPWLFRKLRAAPDDGIADVLTISAIYFVLATLAAGGIYVASLIVAPYLLGEDFHSAIPLMKYIMGAILLQGFFMHNMKFLHYDKSIGVMSACSAIVIVLNLILSMQWASSLGLRGIMLATALSFAVVFAASAVMVGYRLYRVAKVKKGVEPVVSG